MLANHPLIAWASPLVTIVMGDRPSLVLNHRQGTYLLDTYEPRVAQLADGYFTLVVFVPDCGITNRYVRAVPLLRKAMSILRGLIEVRPAIRFAPVVRVAPIARAHGVPVCGLSTTAPSSKPHIYGTSLHTDLTMRGD